MTSKSSESLGRPRSHWTASSCASSTLASVSTCPAVPRPAPEIYTVVQCFGPNNVRARRPERSRNGGGWHELGGALPAIGPADAPLLVTTRSGEGSVALLADAAPLQNASLDVADGAALGLALAGGPRRSA